MQSHIALLKQEFEKKQIHHKISLRTFAKSIDLSPSSLCLIFAGKRNLSYEKALNVCKKLEWKYEKKQEFLNSVTGVEGLTPEPSIELNHFDQTKHLERVEFTAISQWYHHAIIVLFAIDSKLDAEKIAKKLKILEIEAKNAIDRLIRLGFIELHDGKMKLVEPALFMGDTPSQYIQRYHKQMLEKGIEKLETTKYGERSFTGISFPADPEKIDQAKIMIQDFRRNLATLMSSTNSANSAYHLSVQLFRIDEDV